MTKHLSELLHRHGEEKSYQEILLSYQQQQIRFVRSAFPDQATTASDALGGNPLAPLCRWLPTLARDLQQAKTSSFEQTYA